MLTESEKDADRKWADLILSIPIIVKCDCTDIETNSCPEPTICKHENGQRTLMKVRKCPNCYDELFNTFMGADDCEECFNGQITSPLTLADIDWGKSKLKLKEGWEVEE